ncbi:MAG: response regulator [Burkholderiaceae bacterium]
MTDTANTRALIADDEPILAAALQQELADLWPTLEIVGIVHDGDDALARILADKPDVVFLDIRMPGASGLEVAQAIAEDWPGEQAPLIVFVTAHDEFALAAFEREAIDYLTKPVRTDRLARTVARLQQRLAQAPEQSIDTLARQMHRLLDRAPASPPLQWIRAGVGEGSVPG